MFNAAAQTLQYDVVNDFEPVALMPRYPFILVTSNDVPAKNLKELVAWIKANPGKVSQGTVGAGTVQHLCGLSMQDMMGVRWQFVPYRGGAPAMQDLLAGQINFMCTASGSFLPLIRNGQIAPTRSLPRTASRARRIFRPWTRPGCRAFTCRCGTPSMPPRARRKRRSTGSTPPPMPRWPIRRSSGA